MQKKKEFSTKEAAEFLGISRQRFWIIRTGHRLEPIKSFGNTNVYSLEDLLRVKKVRAC